MIEIHVYDIYIYRIKYNSAFKKKKILSLTTTWLNLEDIRLSEINQTQENKN